MKTARLHEWDISYPEALSLQQKLSSRLDFRWEKQKVVFIAGCDVSSEFRGNRLYASVVIQSFPDFDLIETESSSSEVNFPYVPGLLSFREMPVLLRAFEKIRIQPEVILCDGSGLIHPRKFGLACHLGLWLGKPVIGVAKNLLCGEHSEVKDKKGSSAPVILNNEAVGAALRTRSGVKPLYVSPGNHIDIENSLDIVLNSCRKFRIPEPIRAAHKSANESRKLDRPGR